MRSVDEETHDATSQGTGNGDGHEPTESKETNSLPVNSLIGTVAETNTNGGTSDAHGGGNGELVLGEDKDSDGSGQLHGATTRRRVVGDLVTHDLHDVEAVGDETDGKGTGEDSQLPDGDGGGLVDGKTGGPGLVDGSPGTSRVTDIVGTVGERGSAGSDNLDKGVGVLDLVGVSLSVGVDASHASTFGGTGNTNLGCVDIVEETVHEGAGDESRETDSENLEVLSLINLTRSHGVVVESAHGPTERRSALAELGVEAGISLSDELLLGQLPGLVLDKALLVVLDITSVGDLVPVGGLVVAVGQHILVILVNGIVGDERALSITRSLARPEEGTHEDVPPAESVILLEDEGVEEGDEEDGGENGDTTGGTEGNGHDVPEGLLRETQVGRTLVDDAQCADGGGDKEEEGGGVHSNNGRVLAHVNDDLDQHEDDDTESSRDDRGHNQTSEDGTETLTLIPTPFDFAGADNGNTNTGDSRDQRVSRRDVSGVDGAPHNPHGGTSERTSEGEHLNTGVVLEGIQGNNTTLDGGGGASTDSDGTNHLKDRTEHHSPSVGDRTGRDRGGPRVSNIVYRHQLLAICRDLNASWETKRN